mmetsp:Transcript_10220/g.32368  ORF Transcript_10220/g.32368 Transcript_10220/m.32368 type:complete len:239 (+) Transcript_10220:1921-2637(+)
MPVVPVRLTPCAAVPAARPQLPLAPHARHGRGGRVRFDKVAATAAGVRQAAHQPAGGRTRPLRVPLRGAACGGRRAGAAAGAGVGPPRVGGQPAAPPQHVRGRHCGRLARPSCASRAVPGVASRARGGGGGGGPVVRHWVRGGGGCHGASRRGGVALPAAGDGFGGDAGSDARQPGAGRPDPRARGADGDAVRPAPEARPRRGRGQPGAGLTLRRLSHHHPGCRPDRASGDHGSESGE